MLTIVLSGPAAVESQARTALAASGHNVLSDTHDFGLPPMSDQRVETFIIVKGDDVDLVAAAVAPLGWVLRKHGLEPSAPEPDPTAVYLAALERRIAELEAKR